jgi:hypothetical protein
VAENNFKLPADNEVCRNSTTIGSMLFQWLARLSCSVIPSRGEFRVVTLTWPTSFVERSCRPSSASRRPPVAPEVTAWRGSDALAAKLPKLPPH